MSKSKSLQNMYDEHYDGLRETAGKDILCIDISTLVVAIDSKILSYKTYYDTLDEKSDDLEVGVIGGYIEALTEIKDLILAGNKE